MDWLIDGWMRASVIAVYCRKIIELEEELKIVSNNMKSLEIAEQEAWIHFALSNSRSQCRHCIHRITRCIKNVFFIQYTFQTRTSCHDLLGEPTLSCTEGCYIFAAILSFFFERLLDGYPEPTQTTPNPPTGGGGSHEWKCTTIVNVKRATRKRKGSMQVNCSMKMKVPTQVNFKHGGQTFFARFVRDLPLLSHFQNDGAIVECSTL